MFWLSLEERKTNLARPQSFCRVLGANLIRNMQTTRLRDGYESMLRALGFPHMYVCSSGKIIDW